MTLIARLAQNGGGKYFRTHAVRQTILGRFRSQIVEFTSLELTQYRLHERAVREHVVGGKAHNSCALGKVTGRLYIAQENVIERTATEVDTSLSQCFNYGVIVGGVGGRHHDRQSGIRGT